MFLRISFFLFSLLPALTSYAQIIRVKQDSTGDYTTIQAAINASANGDTILVWPGTYYENVNFNGHSITLASLNLTTGNPDYIHQTVIDGNGNSSCIIIKLEENATIQGFTITHGSGRNSNIAGNEITAGGGIFLGEGTTFESLNLINCVIENNYASYTGGGIHVVNASLYLSGVCIKNNLAFRYGGGISVVGDYPILFDTLNLCCIYNNYAPQGYDFTKAINTPPFKIFLDTISVSQPDDYNFTLINDPPINLNDYLSFQHYNTESINNNLYVNPLGNNNNSGLSADQPLKNIAFAMSKIVSDSLHHDTIYLANGTYSKDETDEKFPLGYKSYISLIGKNRDSTILDACNFSFHLFCRRFKLNVEDKIYNINIEHITFINGFSNLEFSTEVGSSFIINTENVHLEDLIFNNNIGYRSSAMHLSSCNRTYLDNVEFSDNIGGVPLRIASNYKSHQYPRIADSVFVTNCIFQRNLPEPDTAIGYGGALFTWSIPYGDSLIVTIENTLFADNKNDNGGYPGAIVGALDYGTAYFVNCTFVNDSAFHNATSSNLGVGDRSKVYLYNSILFHNYPWEIYLYPDVSATAQLSVYNSLIEGGLSGIGSNNWNINSLYYDSTNINTDPLFYGGAEFPYNLSAESPCIDAGTLDLPQFILDNMPATDLAGNPRVYNGKIDMGAYEWNLTVDVKQHQLYQKHKQLTIAPNPFRTQTTVKAKWDKSANITVSIYNNSGLRVKILQSGRQLPGSCQIPWDGTDENGNLLPTGIYHLVLTVDGVEKESVKVVKVR